MYLFLKTLKIGLLFPTHRRPLLSIIQEKPEKIGQGHICGSQMDFYYINEMNVEWLYQMPDLFNGRIKNNQNIEIVQTGSRNVL